MSTKLVTFHGFLGRPSDWDFIDPNPKPINLDLFEIFSNCLSKGDAIDWLQNLRAEIQRLTRKDPITALGYSMGARLVLWLDLLFPDLFSRLILISAHPGLKSDKERQQRLAGDQIWANRFRSEPWDRIISEWNAQPVLDHSSGPVRNELEFNREVLARSLEVLSLGHQPNFNGHIINARKRIDLLVGERDSKFLNILKPCHSANAKLTVVQESGHRIIFEKPSTISEIIVLKQS